jgi:hypothetical protein
VGRQARSEVWNEDFAFNLFVALLPFLVIVGVCVRVEASDRRRRDVEDADQETLAAARLASGSQPST